MATVTKTFTENGLSSYKATWTIQMTNTDITVGGSSTFTFNRPTVIAKFVYSGKTYALAVIGGSMFVNTTESTQNYSWYRGGGYGTTAVATTSGTNYTLTADSSYTQQTQQISWYFNSSNPTVKTLPIKFKASAQGMMLSSGNNQQLSGGNENWYSNSSLVDFGTVANITLNAPPQVTLGTPTYSSPQYAGLGTYSVPLTTLSGQYGGNITSVTLTVGADSTTQTYSTQTVSNKTISVTPTNAGTFTPTVSVTDSRGQTTTKQLSQIVVNGYSVPAVNFDVYRTNSNGVKDDEGTYGLIKASIIYTSAVATLTSPSVSIADSDGTTVTPSSITWYSSYSSSTGVSVAISDWSLVASGDEIYGLIDASFSTTDSYQVTVTETDSLSGSSVPITQTLSTAFYTIDFQAGGKEIAFGAPANDTLTTHQEDVGLLKCGMEAQFNEALYAQANNTFIDGTIDPTQTPTDYIVDRLQIIDANGDRVASFHAEQTTSTNKTGAGFNANRIVNGTDIINGMMFHIDSNGTRTVYLNYPQAFRDALGIVDYVVEEGTISTYTTYRKWASGKAECWYHRNVTGVTTSVWTTPIYYMDTSTFSNIWSGLFNTTPQAVYASSNSSQVINVCVFAFSKNGATSVRYLTCGAKSSMDAPTSFYAVGTWK